MELREYLYIKRIRQVDACRELDMLPGTFGNILRGLACSEELAEYISNWTGGKVPAGLLKKKRILTERCRHCGNLTRKK